MTQLTPGWKVGPCMYEQWARIFLASICGILHHQPSPTLPAPSMSTSYYMKREFLHGITTTINIIITTTISRDWFSIKRDGRMADTVTSQCQMSSMEMASSFHHHNVIWQVLYTVDHTQKYSNRYQSSFTFFPFSSCHASAQLKFFSFAFVTHVLKVFKVQGIFCQM